MRFIHFTHAATDPLIDFGAKGASFVPLADGEGSTHVSCLHLEKGATVSAPSTTHAAALLVVHGRVLFKSHTGGRLRCDGGMGCVLNDHETFNMEAELSSILLIVEADRLAADKKGISTPQRISGSPWPSDPIPE